MYTSHVHIYTDGEKRREDIDNWCGGSSSSFFYFLRVDLFFFLFFFFATPFIYMSLCACGHNERVRILSGHAAGHGKLLSGIKKKRETTGEGGFPKMHAEKWKCKFIFV